MPQPKDILRLSLCPGSYSGDGSANFLEDEHGRLVSREYMLPVSGLTSAELEADAQEYIDARTEPDSGRQVFKIVSPLKHVLPMALVDVEDIAALNDAAGLIGEMTDDQLLALSGSILDSEDDAEKQSLLVHCNHALSAPEQHAWLLP